MGKRKEIWSNRLFYRFSKIKATITRILFNCFPRGQIQNRIIPNFVRNHGLSFSMPIGFITLF